MPSREPPIPTPRGPSPEPSPGPSPEPSPDRFEAVSSSAVSPGRRPRGRFEAVHKGRRRAPASSPRLFGGTSAGRKTVSSVAPQRLPKAVRRRCPLQAPRISQLPESRSSLHRPCLWLGHIHPQCRRPALAAPEAAAVAAQLEPEPRLVFRRRLVPVAHHLLPERPARLAREVEHGQLRSPLFYL